MGGKMRENATIRKYVGKEKEKGGKGKGGKEVPTLKRSPIVMPTHARRVPSPCIELPPPPRETTVDDDFHVRILIVPFTQYFTQQVSNISGQWGVLKSGG